MNVEIPGWTMANGAVARLLVHKRGQPMESGGGSEEGGSSAPQGVKEAWRGMWLTLGNETTAAMCSRSSSMSVLLQRVFLKVPKASHHTEYSFVN